MKIASIIGARPQFIKIAPLVREVKIHNSLKTKPKIKHLIIHSGQHYDYRMSKIFFDELNIPEPDYNLEVGSALHGCQTGEIIKRAEKILIKEKPDLTLVFGDTNTTLGGAIAASKLHIPLVHIEAGLRSYNKEMPEEINRVLTDHCSSVLFCPTENAVENLKKEGFVNIVNEGKFINFSHSDYKISSYELPIGINVGDIMYDSLLMSLEIANKKSTILNQLKLDPKGYYLATVHRAENTENQNRLNNIIDAFVEISKQKPVIFPVHPRTKKSINISNIINDSKQISFLDPVSYFDMLILEKNADMILTDSGGIQKEAYFLKVPCVTLRNETEWVETVKSSWNVLAGNDKKTIIEAIYDHKKSSINSNPPILFGNGNTAKLIIKSL